MGKFFGAIGRFLLRHKGKIALGVAAGAGAAAAGAGSAGSISAAVRAMLGSP
jgi:hypothetical protein